MDPTVLAVVLAVVSAFIPVVAAALSRRLRDSLPGIIVTVASRMMPHEIRSDLVEEWSAELAALQGTGGKWRNWWTRLKYAVPLLLAGPRIARVNRRLSAAKAAGTKITEAPKPGVAGRTHSVVTPSNPERYDRNERFMRRRMGIRDDEE